MVILLSAYFSLGLIWLAAFAALGADGEMASYLFGAPLLLTGAWIGLRDRELGAGAVAVLALFALFVGIAVLQGRWSSGAPEFIVLGACIGVFLSARSFARRPPNPSHISTLLLWFFLLAATVSFLDQVWSPDRIFVFERPFHLGRLSSPFLSANTAATFFGIGVILTIGRIIRVSTRYAGENKSRRLILPIVTLLLCLTCLVLTASRAGILLAGGAAAALLCWELVHRFRRGERQSLWMLAGAGLGLAVAAGFIALISGETFGGRLAGGVDGIETRTELWTAYAGAIRDQLWFGAGPGGFEYINAISADARNASTLVFQRAAHNVVLQWLVQTGLVGLAGLACFWIGTGRRVSNGLRRAGKSRWFIRAVVCVGFFVFAHSLVDYGLEIPAMAWLVAWLTGLACGLCPVRAGSGTRLVRIAVASGMVLLAGWALLGLKDMLTATSVRTASGATAQAILAAPVPEHASLPVARAHSDLALRSTPAHPQHAREALERTLNLEPRDGRAEARLAYALLLSGESRAAANHLGRSYQLWPYAHPDFRTWRLELAAALWNRLPERERTAALHELRQVRPEWRGPWLAQTHACELGESPACIGLTSD
ncbi:O-antigen ligase family protein [Maricaulis sp.]|uniref:O-antigen ligase family protein n=1 Tax=Maricaulis sp. TaxID=1486257 RepID=UPI003A8E23E9